MLKVVLTEQKRVFELRIGNKLVGTVEGGQRKKRNEPGYYCAFKYVFEGMEWKYKYVDSETTLRRAAQRILEELGYGKSQGGVTTRERPVK